MDNNSNVINVEVQEKAQPSSDWNAKFKEAGLPELKSMTRGQRKAFQAAGLDPQKIAVQAAAISKRLDSKDQIPTEEDLDCLYKLPKSNDWILDNVYPDVKWDDVANDVSQEFARQTWARTIGAPTEVKN